jgi:hypothetical protein
VVAKDLYGCDLTLVRKSEIHIRAMEKRLDRIIALDDRPLSSARAPEHRIAGRCNSFALSLVGMLRTKGVPARSRCGFGAYFNAPKLEDHWVCEYWNAERGRWNAGPMLRSMRYGATSSGFRSAPQKREGPLRF